jgi:anti-anti-sigma factor
MPEGRVTHAESGGVHVLRYFGRVDYILAPAIRRFADDLVSHGQVRAWIFDLTQAEILDSTNLGLLARLAARTSPEDKEGKNVILSTSDDINSVLRSMSFDTLFDIVTDQPRLASESTDAHPIPTGVPTRSEVGQTMLDAHRALMALSETGRLEFQDVVIALESDLQDS